MKLSKTMIFEESGGCWSAYGGAAKKFPGFDVAAAEA